MSLIERIGVSLEKDLLADFDALIDKRGYQSRSESIRDLIRMELSREQMKDPDATAIAAICVVFDHHNTLLARRLMELQHTHLLQTISSMHIHVSEQDCLETIVLKGKVSELTKLAENIVALKGVKLGKINLIGIDEEGHEHGHGHSHNHGHGHDHRH